MNYFLTLSPSQGGGAHIILKRKYMNFTTNHICQNTYIVIVHSISHLVEGHEQKGEEVVGVEPKLPGASWAVGRRPPPARQKGGQAPIHRVNIILQHLKSPSTPVACNKLQDVAGLLPTTDHNW